MNVRSWGREGSPAFWELPCYWLVDCVWKLYIGMGLGDSPGLEIWDFPKETNVNICIHMWVKILYTQVITPTTLLDGPAAQLHCRETC